MFAELHKYIVLCLHSDIRIKNNVVIQNCKITAPVFSDGNSKSLITNFKIRFYIHFFILQLI
ncbi:hypothetical protein BMETH_1747_0 [methanotrophic bacterial endosymbiont of Bathymodiolus sp.]|nr:hypothetical protein BMETH_1747_0 [methanotrophic bacterial endosymbiont of Bathymodiolus sp.]